jgi:ribosomal protein S18 acetylase RimI-like enzyme
MKIRTAGTEDVGSLVAFNQAMAQETEGKSLDPVVLTAGVQAVFDDDRRGFYVVAEDDEKIIGGLLVTYEWSDWRNGWFWWIQSVYVLPEFRGRGVYRNLYEHIRAEASKTSGVCGFRLYVEKENVAAQKVYEKLGMEKTYYLMYEELEK